MKRGSLFSVCFLVLFIGNCPKRQTATRIVYEPPPAPAPEAAGQESNGALVIAEPQPPEAEEDTEPVETAPAEKPPAKRRPRPAHPEPTLEPSPEPEPPPAVEVPALEPRENPNQQAAQRQQIARLREQVHARLARLEKSSLAAEERRMMEDARTFLSQSEGALNNNDLQRAANLARKASMLVAVLEQE